MSLSRHMTYGVRRFLSRWSTPKSSSSSQLLGTSAVRLGIFEPDDVGLGPEIPEYEAINVQMKAYDFAVLEAYAKYIHNLAERLGIDSECWAVPPKTSDVQIFKPQSTVVEKEYSLSFYERCVQLQDLPSTTLPIFLEAARANLPAGVQLTMKEPDELEEEDRYIPDKELMELQEQVATIEQAREERRKK